MQELTTGILIVGSTDDAPDIQYLTGFRVGDPVVLLTCRKQKWLVVQDLEYGRARNTINSRVNVVTPNMLGVSRKQWGNMSVLALKLLQRAGCSRIVVDARFPHAVARRLEKGGIRISIEKSALCPERQRKTPTEIDRIRACQEAAVNSFYVAKKILATARVNGKSELHYRGQLVTSEMLRREISMALLKRDCFCRDLIAASGILTAQPHERGHGPVHAHEPIILDIFPQHQATGYWGDFTRTLVKGQAPRELKKMYYAVRAAQDAALKKIRPGVKCRTIHAAAAEELLRRGFETDLTKDKRSGFIHSTGHGLGLEIHEAPRLGFSDERLKKNQVVTIEPGLYYPHIGGVRIEDTVVVTSKGFSFLARCERQLEV